jgi:two-component system, sensor histidine kinase and response regulator
LKISNKVRNILDIFVANTGLPIEVAKEIFNVYILSMPDMLRNIQDPMLNNDFENLANLAHKLKGSSGTLNINELYELARTHEQHAIHKKKSINAIQHKRCFRNI